MDSAVARRNFLIYSGVSTVLAAISISNVLRQKPNFYSLLIALSHDVHIIVLSNFLIVSLILFGKMCQSILFGELRLIEREHVYERSWFTMMNLLMAIAMFRDENNLLIGFLILSLLFLKIFHWILVDRIQYVFQSNESIKDILLSRTSFTLILFLVLDYEMILNCIDNSFNGSPDVYVIFGFDFALLFFDLFEEFGKLVLNLIEIWYLDNNETDDVWEFKTVLLKFFEIGISFIKILTIFFNFFILIGPYRMPITVMRESYLTVSKFVGQISEFIRYRRAAKELDRRLQDATQEDLDHDDTCIICRDEMSVEVLRNTRLFPKKLNCGHVIHLGCLKSWMERSESCPMCRSPVFVPEQEQNQQQTQQQPQQNNIPPIIPQPRGRILTRLFGLPPFMRNRANNVPVPAQVQATAETENDEEEEDRPTPTPTTTPIYHEPIINLPSNTVILPPDWSVFPLMPRPQLDPRNAATTEFDIFLNPTTKGVVKTIKVHHQPLNLIPNPVEEIREVETGSSSSGDRRRNLLRRGTSIRQQYESMLQSFSNRLDDIRSRHDNDNNTRTNNDNENNEGNTANQVD